MEELDLSLTNDGHESTNTPFVPLDPFSITTNSIDDHWTNIQKAQEEHKAAIKKMEQSDSLLTEEDKAAIATPNITPSTTKKTPLVVVKPVDTPTQKKRVRKTDTDSDSSRSKKKSTTDTPVSTAVGEVVQVDNAPLRQRPLVFHTQQSLQSELLQAHGSEIEVIKFLFGKNEAPEGYEYWGEVYSIIDGKYKTHINVCGQTQDNVSMWMERGLKTFYNGFDGEVRDDNGFCIPPPKTFKDVERLDVVLNHTKHLDVVSTRTRMKIETRHSAEYGIRRLSDRQKYPFPNIRRQTATLADVCL